MNLFLSLLGLVGATLIVVSGTIFAPLQRFWPAFFRCAQCVGMWVGLFAGAIGISEIHRNPLLNAFLVGGATSCVSLLVHAVLLNLLGEPESD